jgi:hypothetical protein
VEKAFIEGNNQSSKASDKQDKKRIKELEKELRRKDKSLAEAAALLVLRKKFNSNYGSMDNGS